MLVVLFAVVNVNLTVSLGKWLPGMYLVTKRWMPPASIEVWYAFCILRSISWLLHLTKCQMPSAFYEVWDAVCIPRSLRCLLHLTKCGRMVYT